MRKIKAIIFDMDGVIFDSESVWKTVFTEANERFGLQLDESYRQSTCGKSEKAIREELIQHIPTLNVDEYRDYILKGVASRIASGMFAVKQGFLELISFARRYHYRVALATSSQRQRAENMFLCKGMDEKKIFDVCIYGEDVGIKGKPNPYIFELAAQRMGVRSDECVVLEDSINGIKAAADGGFIPIMTVDLIAPDEYCLGKCKAIVNNLSSVIEYLENEE